MYSIYRTIQNESSVSVGSSSTILVAASETGPSDNFSGQIVNNDVSQTLAFWIETSWNGSRWSRSEWQGGQNVAPGEARPFTVDCSKYRYVRVSGQASGGGLNATCSGELGYSTGPGGSNRR